MRTSEASAFLFEAPLQGSAKLIPFSNEKLYGNTEFSINLQNLLEQYKEIVSENALLNSFNKLEDIQLSTPFSFHHAVASVYSSKIEGEAIKLDSYIKHKRFHIEFQPDYTCKIDDLYLAYQFASENRQIKRRLQRCIPF